uniref:Transmembrane protein 229B n=1 Tax=Timema bartmani TaxID=61472 RepID=A0A7R9ERV6_9NEOP|nr:unnamed protein product [Timema bartmani]
MYFRRRRSVEAPVEVSWAWSRHRISSGIFLSRDPADKPLIEKMGRSIRTKPILQEELTLSLWIRLYVYGLHGYFIEVMFTAGWEFVVADNWKLPGCSSIWSFPIYGISGLVMEVIYSACSDANVPLFARGAIYLVWVYLWEFSTGILLRQFGACSWDYSAFDYNVHGLITFEYAPLWYCISLLMEKLVTARLLSLRWASNGFKSTPSNGLVTKIKD